MSIWIVTTGNSDVILKHDQTWSMLYEQALDKLECWEFASANKIDIYDQDAGYTLPARVLGIVYQNQLDDYFDDLSFPLLDGFTEYLKSKNDDENLSVDKIILILTNQENVFDSEIEDAKCPYWQDTCTLKPILEKYFEQKFPKFKGEIEYLELKPNSPDEGLDNWDKCLILVNRLFQRNITNINNKKEKKKDDKQNKVFVSHQAGTPAISSAVQFASLAKFEKQVEFLVSNEYQKEKVIPISSSNYLKGLKLQEAKELLDRYDYDGVGKIFTELWKNQSLTEQEEKIKELLAMAIYWNSANFDDFAKARSAINEDAKKRTQEWWWTSYEAGYLAVIRLRQGNYVEALFHSFRAVEGLLRYMDKNKYEHKGIHDLVEIVLLDWKLSDDIKMFKNFASRERNNLFHNLRGLKQDEVFQSWNTKNYSDWQNRVRGCLNFVTKQQFDSLEKASLMSSLHEELKVEINSYE
ncbi:hypothetical protein PN471_00700 [Aphanizomenon sp. CS-733/32]|uniref:hypothetical protein n=1 Tax=Aphanizomenon sp. CS-733/32 TaxID=3021715 RepID=UPI002330064F|nr:hypothetical protein [Aphanizomenon sp. CS-733/32]MDB9307203.1 hypothetical protein [Aphanizomenon sp. CS-733/32]